MYHTIKFRCKHLDNGEWVSGERVCETKLRVYDYDRSTDRPQKPRECEHCTECGSPKTPICSILYWKGTWSQDAACKLYRGDKHCPDFTPKKDKQ